MKSFVISRGNNWRGDNGQDLRAQTRPSGDIEIVAVSDGRGDNSPSNKTVGIIPHSEIPALIQFLHQQI